MADHQYPADLQQLIAAMARANVTWGEERIAAELLLKLGLRVSPRTVRRYMSLGGRPRNRRSSQQWSTFVRNHASAMLACDFFVAITARFRTLYVFVVLEVGTRRIVHWNVTEHPTADWTVQQFRAVVPGDQPQRFLIHDRDSIYAAAVDGGGCRNGPDGAENAGALPASECVLREADRHDPSRVFGLADCSE